MKTVKQAVCVLILLVLISTAGCSGEVVADTSDSSTKNSETISYLFWPIRVLVSKAELAVMHDMIRDYIDDDKISGSSHADFQYLVDKGYLPVIPRNPYTGKDIRESKDYSPGDFYFEYDFFKGGELTKHLGEGHYEYSPEMYERGEVEENWHAISPTNDEQWLIGTFDGRSKTHYMPGWDKFETEDLTGIEPYSTKLEEANERMHYMYKQMNSLFGSLSDIADEPGDTLDETISAIGHRNPAAWINPFTGMPMKEVQIWGPMGYPDSIKAVNPDKEEYAGNYSYVTYEWKGKTWGLLAFYYLRENGALQAISCSTHDQEPYED